MEVEKKLLQTYLSFQKYNTGKLAAFLVIGICFVLSNFYWDQSSFISSYLNASWDLVVGKGEYWRLFTTSFIHGDLDHLLSNSLMLFILTYFVTTFYGSFIAIMVSFIMAMGINLLTLSQYDSATVLVGASGVVYYLWGFWLVLYICIDKKVNLIRRVIRVMGIFFILLIPTTYSPNTSYLAHYIGFVFGLFTGALYYFIRYGHISQFEKWEYKIISPPSQEEIEVYGLNPKEYPNSLE